eukprot:282470_1
MATDLQMKNKWWNQQIHSSIKKKRRNCKSSWRHYNQIKCYKKYLINQKRQHTLQQIKYYNPDDPIYGYHKPIDNTAKLRSYIQSEDQLTLDIVIKINAIKSKNDNTYKLLNSNINIFDYSTQKYWPSYTFLFCSKSNDNNFHIIDNFEIPNNVNSKKNTLLEIAIHALQNRLPPIQIQAYINHYSKHKYNTH